ncbi:CAMKK protein kinase, variant [Aphanomyces invadans]|uniref:CAMKK protein kinase, variant n=1 Tax=Aphanomyces invadans TaxID=157072 RepID=A0A024UPG1_9STRA|nr:CAMKK protein kinase, variant [Aphanomyces invadans]ETW07498.1 CAMKK protein kinase, variant [Aphanomyces invadans]|eukprot:XP_008863591.1 CAMKK protein kinase, variant [Aphanomyces invadans]
MGVRGEWQCLITAHEDASQDGTDRVNEYFMMENLGKGAFAKVKRCERRVENTNPRSFAAKIMSKSALHRMKEYVREGESMRVVTALDKVEAEIEIMRTLYHRNIVLLFEVINDPASDKIYLILEYMSKGPCMVYTPASKTFHSPITGGPLTEELAKEHVRGIVQGVKYLHSRGVCHRDIKTIGAISQILGARSASSRRTGLQTHWGLFNSSPPNAVLVIRSTHSW